MLVSELDVDDVISWFSGAVGDLTGAVLLILSVDVHFTGSLNGQAQATIACMEKASECLEENLDDKPLCAGIFL